MQGSEKQIQWAEEIRATWLDWMEKTSATMSEIPTCDLKSQIEERIQSVRQGAERQEARYFIEKRQQVERYIGEIYSNASKLSASVGRGLNADGSWDATFVPLRIEWRSERS
jgi:hypothetical protein